MLFLILSLLAHADSTFSIAKLESYKPKHQQDTFVFRLSCEQDPFFCSQELKHVIVGANGTVGMLTITPKREKKKNFAILEVLLSRNIVQDDKFTDPRLQATRSLPNGDTLPNSITRPLALVDKLEDSSTGIAYTIYGDPVQQGPQGGWFGIVLSNTRQLHKRDTLDINMTQAFRPKSLVNAYLVEIHRTKKNGSKRTAHSELGFFVHL